MNFLQEQEEELPLLSQSMVSTPREKLSLLESPAKEQIKSMSVSEQPDLVEDVPAHCRGAGLDDL